MLVLASIVELARLGQWGMHDWWWGGFFMFIFWAVVIGLFVWALVHAAGRREGGSGPGPGLRTHLDILKERLAKGEISEEEYDRLRRKLEE